MREFNIFFYVLKIIKSYFDINSFIDNIASILNIVIIIFIFKTEQKKREEQENIAKKEFWFRNIVLDRNLKYLEDFFKNIILNFSSIQLNITTDIDDLLRSKIVDFQREKRELLNRLNDDIRIINTMIGDDLDYVLDNIEDFSTNEIQNLLLYDSNEDIDVVKNKYESRILQYRQEYLKTIYKFEIKGYEC